MRLTDEEIEAIKAASREVFGNDAIVRLFGSRVDDAKRGGDIDLLIEMSEDRTGIAYQSRFLTRLFSRIDERKIDLVLTRRGEPMAPFAAMVATHAVALP